MSKKFFLALALLLFFVVPAFAQTPGDAMAPKSTTSNITSQIQSVKNDKENSTKELMKAKIQAFKQRIQDIKDEKKKAIVEKIDDHVATANARLTTKMNNALTRMTSILNELQQRSTSLKANGKDTTAVDAAITDAQKAITDAQTAVNGQSQKEYSANIVSDAGIRSAIGQMVSTFRNDITATHKAVVDAKQAIVKVLTMLSTLTDSGDNSASGSAATNSQL
jgi:exonuclease VII large subunit